MDITQMESDDVFIQSPSESDMQDITTRVVSIISEVQKTPVSELPPLHRSINTDSLDSLFQDQKKGQEVQVQFTYAGTSVAIDSDGRIIVPKPED